MDVWCCTGCALRCWLDAATKPDGCLFYTAGHLAKWVKKVNKARGI